MKVVGARCAVGVVEAVGEVEKEVGDKGCEIF